MIKAVIFDFDGVIVDSETKKFNDLKNLLRDFNYNLNDSSFKKMIGKKTGFFLRQEFPNISEENIDEISRKRRVLELNNPSLKLILGIKKLLEFLKSKKIKIAITSGTKKQIIKLVLKNNKLEDYFDLIVGGEDFKKSKPSPECFLIALNNLELKPSEAIIIEDSVSGIDAGKDSGAIVFGIETYFKKNQLKKADKIFENHCDLLYYLESNKLF
jgi:putative hydrolase of the HAD superfamily